jgi:hypothetical protein
MKVDGVCSAHMKPSAVVEILKLRITVGGETFCPHLGSHFPHGNIHQGRIISQTKCCILPMFRRKQVPSLAYYEFKDGFRPLQWHFHINKDEDKSLFLFPDKQDCTNGKHFSNMVNVHRPKNENENLFLLTQKRQISSKNTMQ